MSDVVKVFIPQPVGMPRGAFWAAAAVEWVVQVLFARRQKDRP